MFVKQELNIWLFLVLLLLESCNEKSSYPISLVMADSVMYAHPDSALSILRGYSDSAKMSNIHNRMYYDLLLTTAEDKCYITHTDDSTMLHVVDYYEKQGEPEKLADAYRMMGRVYDDIHNTPTAVDYYQKAIDKYLKFHNYKQLYLTYTHLADLYFNQHLQDESITAYKKAYDYALLGKDKLQIVYAVRNIGRLYTMYDQVDSALYYYNKAFDMGDDEFRKEAVSGELASIYIQIEEYGEAYRVLSYNHEAYTIWADYYEGIGKSDSAISYYKKALIFGNIYAKEDACNHLAQYENLRGNKDASINYLQKAILYKDTIFDETKSAEVKEIEAKYNYEKIKTERNALILDKEKQKNIIVVLSFIIVLIIISVFLVYSKIKYRLAYVEDQKERAKQLKEVIENANPKPLEELPLYMSIVENSTNDTFVLTENRWDELMAEINQHFLGFTMKLKTLYPRIKKIEIVVCCLVKLDVPNLRIATMLCKSPAAISNLRKRLYAKIHGKIGSSRDFDEFVKNI